MARPAPELTAWCVRQRTAAARLWLAAPNTATAGLARDALYLLRPDTYVALAEQAAPERWIATSDGIDRLSYAA